ncbi:MAG: 30S ribosomal protein S6 [Candidatus Wallbacteria bacterium]
MKAYECFILLDPKFDEAEVEKTVAKVEEMIQKGGCVLENITRWGKKRLAYKIDKISEAYYVIFNYKAQPSFNSELEKNLRFMNGMVRSVIFSAMTETKKAAKPVQAAM